MIYSHVTFVVSYFYCFLYCLYLYVCVIHMKNVTMDGNEEEHGSQ